MEAAGGDGPAAVDRDDGEGPAEEAEDYIEAEYTEAEEQERFHFIQRLRDFYSVHNPEQAVDEERLLDICDYYWSNQDEMNALLREKYGADLDSLNVDVVVGETEGGDLTQVPREPARDEAPSPSPQVGKDTLDHDAFAREWGFGPAHPTDVDAPRPAAAPSEEVSRPSGSSDQAFPPGAADQPSRAPSNTSGQVLRPATPASEHVSTPEFSRPPSTPSGQAIPSRPVESTPAGEAMRAGTPGSTGSRSEALRAATPGSTGSRPALRAATPGSTPSQPGSDASRPGTGEQLARSSSTPNGSRRPSKPSVSASRRQSELFSRAPTTHSSELFSRATTTHSSELFSRAPTTHSEQMEREARAQDLIAQADETIEEREAREREPVNDSPRHSPRRRSKDIEDMLDAEAQRLKEKAEEARKAKEKKPSSTGSDQPPAGKKKLPKGQDSSNYFNRICRVTGCIYQARGLHKPEKGGGRLSTFILVKGIRSNLFLEHIAMSDLVEGTAAPQWNLAFEFEVPAEWGTTELLGLKFLCFHCEASERASALGTDTFLGGVDLDVSDAKPGRLTRYELELGGQEQKKTRAALMEKKRRAQLMVELTVFREYLLRPQPLSTQLQVSLKEFKRIRSLYVRLHSGKNLTETCTYGDPVIIIAVRVMFTNGDIELMFETPPKKPSSCVWDITERLHFERGNEPCVLHFDLYEKPRLEPGRKGNHLGTAVYELVDLGEAATKVCLKLKDHLLEKRFDRQGKVKKGMGRSRKAAKEQEKDPDSAKRGFVAAMRLMRRAIGSESKPPFIFVILGASWRSQQMPHESLIDTPFLVRNEDDAQQAHEDWIASKSVFAPPSLLRQRVVKAPHMLEATGHIIFVSGVIQGAAELLSADFMGKSDPYCIVEAFARNKDEPLFVHRTRIIQNCLCPAWEEHFHASIPDDFDAYMLLFTVYDSDEDTMMANFGPGDEDDMLGRAAVDLAYLKNGEQLYGEAPLVGARKTVANAGFRRTSRIDIHLNVIRRVLPVLRSLSDEALGAPQRHMLSRIPPSNIMYENPSQEVVYGPVAKSADISLFFRSGALLRQAVERKALAGGQDTDAILRRTIDEPKNSKKKSEAEEGNDFAAAEEDDEVEPFTQAERLASAHFDLGSASRRWLVNASESRVPSAPKRSQSVPDDLNNYSIPPVYARFGTSSLAQTTFAPGGLLQQARGLAPIVKAVTASTFREDRMRMSEARAFRQFGQRPELASISMTG